MGSCFSNPEAVEKKKRNNEIDHALREEAKKSQTEIKVLMLGTSEAGKSTILKQFRLIYAEKYTDSERLAFRAVVQSNIFSSILSILRAHERRLTTTSTITIPTMVPPILGAASAASTSTSTMATTLTMAESSEETRVAMEVIRRTSAGTRAGVSRMTEEEEVALKCVWADESIKDCAKMGYKFNLMDCATYFLNDLDRICAERYLPTDQDILHARTVTTVVQESKFRILGTVWRIFDVGGHRSARKRWAPYFDDVSSILFVVAISSYDQTLAEDSAVNRIAEALALCKAVINHPLFASTSIILFLNKIDLFKKKIKVSPIEQYFPKFKPYESAEGDTTTELEWSVRFFKNKFVALNNNAMRTLYVHETWATGTQPSGQ